MTIGSGDMHLVQKVRSVLLLLKLNLIGSSYVAFLILEFFFLVLSSPVCLPR